jgi:hypothetical protein
MKALKRSAGLLALAILLFAFPAAAASKPAAPALVSFSEAPSKRTLRKVSAAMLAQVKDEPREGGASIGEAELDKLLSPYRKRAYAGERSFFSAVFEGEYKKKSGKWTTALAGVRTAWIDGKTGAIRYERMCVSDASEPKKAGAIDCLLVKPGDAGAYLYTWVKFSKKGQLSKVENIADADIPAGASVYAVPKPLDSESCKIYPDRTLCGQACKLYSFGNRYQTTYYWLSVSKGYEIKAATYSIKGQKMIYTYDLGERDAPASVYAPPEDVAFQEGEAD